MSCPSDQNFLRVVICSDSHLRCVNHSVYVDRCLDKFSWFAECLSGFHLRRVNNSGWVDLCLDNLFALVSTEKTWVQRSRVLSAFLLNSRCGQHLVLSLVAKTSLVYQLPSSTSPRALHGWALKASSYSFRSCWVETSVVRVLSLVKPYSAF